MRLIYNHHPLGGLCPGPCSVHSLWIDCGREHEFHRDQWPQDHKSIHHSQNKNCPSPPEACLVHLPTCPEYLWCAMTTWFVWDHKLVQVGCLWLGAMRSLVTGWWMVDVPKSSKLYGGRIVWPGYVFLSAPWTTTTTTRQRTINWCWELDDRPIDIGI